jgi:hypothetical protein
MLTFFCTTFLCLRVFFPLLIDRDGPDPAACDRLRRLAAWPSRYIAAAVTLYFLAGFAVLSLADSADDRMSMFILGIVGLPAFLFAWFLSKQIERDVAALSIAVSPDLDPLGATGS